MLPSWIITLVCLLMVGFVASFGSALVTTFSSNETDPEDQQDTHRHKEFSPGSLMTLKVFHDTLEKSLKELHKQQNAKNAPGRKDSGGGDGCGEPGKPQSITEKINEQQANRKQPCFTRPIDSPTVTTASTCACMGMNHEQSCGFICKRTPGWTCITEGVSRADSRVMMTAIERSLGDYAHHHSDEMRKAMEDRHRLETWCVKRLLPLRRNPDLQGVVCRDGQWVVQVQEGSKPKDEAIEWNDANDPEETGIHDQTDPNTLTWCDPSEVDTTWREEDSQPLKSLRVYRTRLRKQP